MVLIFAPNKKDVNNIKKIGITHTKTKNTNLLFILIFLISNLSIKKYNIIKNGIRRTICLSAKTIGRAEICPLGN